MFSRPLFSAARSVTSVACSTPAITRALRHNLPKFFSSVQRRTFTAGAPELASTLQSELQHEKSNYERAANISKFLDAGVWKLEEKDGDINMRLKREVNGLQVTVEFQLVSPTYPGEEEEEGATPETNQETTDFSVTVEKGKGKGAIFYCTTVGNDEKYRFVVGNVRYFDSEEEKTGTSAYNGPEFEDLDDNLQQGIDEWLATIGINEEMCDFVDAMAVDKEQREYMRWLGCFMNVIQ